MTVGMRRLADELTTKREDVANNRPSAMAATGQIPLSAQPRDATGRVIVGGQLARALPGR